MTQIVSLFNNQRKAGEAIKALSDAELGETDVRIVEEWGKEIDEGSVSVTAYNPYASAGDQAAVAKIKTWTPDLTDDEQAFFRTAVKEGGVLVIVEMPNDDNVSQVEKILEAQGGQAAKR
jgi:hypothetical protein